MLGYIICLVSTPVCGLWTGYQVQIPVPLSFELMPGNGWAGLAPLRDDLSVPFKDKSGIYHWTESSGQPQDAVFCF